MSGPQICHGARRYSHGTGRDGAGRGGTGREPLSDAFARHDARRFASKYACTSDIIKFDSVRHGSNIEIVELCNTSVTEFQRTSLRDVVWSDLHESHWQSMALDYETNDRELRKTDEAEPSHLGDC